MTPEQRRALYGHLSDAIPHLRAAKALALKSRCFLVHGRLDEAHYGVLDSMGAIQKEMDDASDV